MMDKKLIKILEKEVKKYERKWSSLYDESKDSKEAKEALNDYSNMGIALDFIKKVGNYDS